MSIKRLLLGQQSRARAHERYWDLSYIGIHLCRLGEKLINRNLKSAGHDGNSTKEEKISTTCAEIVAGWEEGGRVGGIKMMLTLHTILTAQPTETYSGFSQVK